MSSGDDERQTQRERAEHLITQVIRLRNENKTGKEIAKETKEPLNMIYVIMRQLVKHNVVKEHRRINFKKEVLRVIEEKYAKSR